MKKTIAGTLIFLAVAASIFTLVPLASSQAVNIKVVDYNWYIDPNGILDVVGVVQNQGPNTVDRIAVMGEAARQDGGAPVSSGAPAWCSLLGPNQKAPFYMEFYPPETGNGWYGAGVGEIQLNIYQANPIQQQQYPDLKVVESKASIGNSAGLNGAYVVNGQIQNVGTQTATNITVTASFYNSEGKVVGVGYTNYLKPADLSPSAKISFQIAALDLNQTIVQSELKISSYLLRVESESPKITTNQPIITPNPANPDSPTTVPTTGPSTQAEETPIPGQVDTSKPASSSPIGTYTIIAVAVIVAAILSFLALRRLQKPPQTAKEAAKTRKQHK